MSKYRLPHILKIGKNALLFLFVGVVLFDLAVFFFFADMSYIDGQREFSFSRVSLVYMFLFTFIPLFPLAWIWGGLFFPLYKFNKKLGWFLLLFFSSFLCGGTIYLNSVSYFKKMYFNSFDTNITSLSQRYDFYINKRYGCFNSLNFSLNVFLINELDKVTFEKLPLLVKKEWGNKISDKASFFVFREKNNECYIATLNQNTYYFYFIEK